MPAIEAATTLLLRIAAATIALGRVVAAVDTLAWQAEVASPAPWGPRYLQGYASVSLTDGTSLSFGGWDGSTRNADTFALESGARQLTFVGTATWSARQSPCGVTLLGTDTVCIAGGDSAGTYSNDAWCTMDKGATWTRTAASGVFGTSGRSRLGCVSSGPTTIVLFGGYSPGSYFSDTRISTNTGASWTTLSRSQCASQAHWTGRDNFATAYMPILGRIVIVGGESYDGVASKYTNDVWSSDDGGRCWIERKANDNGALGLFGASLAVIEAHGAEILLLVGGAHRDASATTFLNAVQRSFDSGATWAPVANVGAVVWTPRKTFPLIYDSLNKRLALFGGYGSTGQGGGTYLSDMWTAPTGGFITPNMFFIIDAFCGSPRAAACRVEGGETLTIVGNGFADVTALVITIDGMLCAAPQSAAGSSGAYEATCTTPCFPLSKWNATLSIAVSGVCNAAVSGSGSSAGCTGASAPIAFNTSQPYQPGAVPQVVVRTAAAFGSAASENFVCAHPPVITNVSCLVAAECGLTSTMHLIVPENTLIVIHGHHFGEAMPSGAQVDPLALYLGAVNCWSRVRAELWSSTTIVVVMCAAESDGTKLAVSITLGSKVSAPSTTRLNPTKGILCLPGEFSHGNDTCTKCPAGRHGLGTSSGATACFDCTQGRFASTEGRTDCAFCPPDTITGVGTLRSVNCSRCAAGEIRDPAGAYCAPCAAGTKKVLAASGKYICNSCPAQQIAPAGEDECHVCARGSFPDKRAGECVSCTSGSYRAADGKCWSCPHKGTICEFSELQILGGWWVPSSRNETMTLETKLYSCANDEACLRPKANVLSVDCDASQGYEGILCGACDRKKNFIRSNDVCAHCPPLGVSVVAVLFIGAFLLGSMVYYVGFQSYDAGDASDDTGVTLKLLMSFNQMLSILGIFKARGTAAFRQIVTWPTSILGGGVTSMLFLKCWLGSPLYAPFMIAMVLPFVALIATVLLSIPKWHFERAREAEHKAAGLDAPPPANKAKLLVALKNAGGFRDRQLLRIAPCWPREELSEERKATWRAERGRKLATHFDPLLHLATVMIFVLFSLYPSLVQSAVGVLRCSEPIEGKRYLVQDFAKECFTAEHFFFVACGIVGIVVYAVGIPLSAFLLVFLNRHQIAEGEGRAHDALGFLFAGYSTSRGGIVLSWEVFVMVRKLITALLGTFDLSATVQVLCALLLLVISYALTVNVRPYETRWLNWLEEGGLFALILTQTLSLGYLDMDASAAEGEGRNATLDVLTTTTLVVLNATAFIAFGCALLAAVARHYGPKVRCCTQGSACERGMSWLVDETWEEGSFVPSRTLKLVWPDGAPPPPNVEVKWYSIKREQIVEAITRNGSPLPPPIGCELAYVDASGAMIALPVDAAPQWIDIDSGEPAPLTIRRRVRTEWHNLRTGTISTCARTGSIEAHLGEGRGAPVLNDAPPHLEDGGRADGGRADDAQEAARALPTLEPVRPASASQLALHTPPTGTTFIPMAAEHQNNATLNPLVTVTSVRRDAGEDSGVEMSINFL